MWMQILTQNFKRCQKTDSKNYSSWRSAEKIFEVIVLGFRKTSSIILWSGKWKENYMDLEIKLRVIKIKVREDHNTVTMIKHR